MKQVNFDHLLMTELDVDNHLMAEARAKELLGTLQAMFKDYDEKRREKTDRMVECWATYLGTPNAERWKRQSVLKGTVGDVTVDWRHHINRGKGYEIVETVVPYLKGATFPNDDWFDLIPDMPIQDEQYLLFIKIMKHFIKHKLDVSHFREQWELFLRQLCIVGTSVLALPWRVETAKKKVNVKVVTPFGEGHKESNIDKLIYNSPDIQVEDMLDVFLDPNASNPNDSNLIRRMRVTRGQIQRLVESGSYDLIEPTDIRKIKCYRKVSDETNTIEDFLGFMNNEPTQNDQIEIYEFWGCIHLSDIELSDVVITWSGDTLLRVETNPYWAGKPFVVGTYTPILSSPYGFGALEPILGDLHEVDILGNSRLDGLTISLLPTYLYRADGTVSPEDLTVEPGKYIPVNGDPNNAVVPMAQDLRYASVSVQEEQLREGSIDRRTGTGSFIGSGQGRSGERVTAAEVEAVRTAGGSRLSGVYEHIENTALLPVLERCYGMMQQFIVKDEIIPVPGNSPEEILYVKVGIDQLAYDFFIKAKGAAHVADKEYELRQRTDWISLMNSNQEMAKYVNWKEVAKDLTKRFTGEDASKFIQEEPTPPPPDPNAQQQQQPSPLQSPQAMQAQALVQGAQAIDGKDGARAAQIGLATDGGVSMTTPMQQNTTPQPTWNSPNG